MDWLYPLSGLLVGLIVGLTGVGGGSLMTPLLVLGFGISPATAVGTDLLYAALTKAGGTVAHQQKSNINWRIVGLLGAGSVPAAIITVYVLHALGTQSKAFNSIITTTLGVALILTALSIILRGLFQKQDDGREFLRTLAISRGTAINTVIVGLTLGVLVTVSSVGAGALGTLALFLLYPRLSARQVVGTDIAHAVPLTLIGGLGHAALGTVDFTLLGSLLLGSLPGIWLGSHLSSHVPERILRSLLATMLFIIGGKFVL
ncbi:MAG: sulfite exporter TauE/SafE family protein [Burkholderiales bacterium]